MASGNSGTISVTGTKNMSAVLYWSETYDVASNTHVVSIDNITFKSSNWYGFTYYLKGTISVNGTQVFSCTSASGSHHVRIDSQNAEYSIAASSGYSSPPWKSGSITGNTAGAIFGGGLCSNSANPVGLRGKVTITGNTADGDPDNYFQSSDHIINASGLTEGSSIGVGVHFTRRPTGDTPLVLTDEGCNPEYFTADNYRYVIKASDTGEILLALPTVQHTHAWSATWASDADAHWHVCTAPGCTVTQNSQKSGYAPHVYDKEIVADNYKKSDATEDSAAVYYKSCICGAKGTETFTHGSPLPPSHTHTANTEKW